MGDRHGYTARLKANHEYTALEAIRWQYHYTEIRVVVSRANTFAFGFPRSESTEKDGYDTL